MVILSLKTSTEKKVSIYGSFLIQQMSGHPLTQEGVGADFIARQDRLIELFDEIEEVEGEMGKVEGRTNWLDLEAYRAAKLFHSALLNRLGYNRKSPLYRRIFPEGFRKFRPAKIEDKGEWLELMVSELSHHNGEYDDLVTSLEVFV